MDKEYCYHCQQDIQKERILFDEKVFCCNGCKSVYEILNINSLTNYYELNDKAGIKPAQSDKFEYLNTPEVFDKLVSFSENGTTVITFKIPVIHCAACIWLLESLPKLNENIIFSQVNFTSKTIQISYKSQAMKLSELALFLTNLGYKPVVTLDYAEDVRDRKINTNLLIKLVIAGFSFGNVMLLAFPEFIDKGENWLEKYNTFFRFFMFIFALPVFFYSATDYYKSAWYAIKNKRMSVDIPIVIGIFALFFRSCYEVYFNIGNGYFDSFCGLIFFMLIGKYFQEITYKTLSFSKDYKSFYPISVTKISFENKQEEVLVSTLQVGDRVLIRNGEIIPADCVLIKGEASVDNSFITGESKLVKKEVGDKIFAGGKQEGGLIEVELIKVVDESYLVKLWSNETFRKEDDTLDVLTNKISKYFVIVVLFITLLSSIYWGVMEGDVSKMFMVIVSVLIVACPCALALSYPFTMGNIMRVLGGKGFYIRNSTIIERASEVTHIVFDKTGTLTINGEHSMRYEGKEISSHNIEKIVSILNNSNHPLSKSLFKSIDIEDRFYEIENYQEIAGKGIIAKIGKDIFKIGSAGLVGVNKIDTKTSVYISINDEVQGRYIGVNNYRKSIDTMVSHLKHQYSLVLLSGDDDGERDVILNKIGIEETLFNQKPQDKLEYIKQLQDQGAKVMMIGDGLNDAGAIKQANVGVALADDVNGFTPSSDVIMASAKMASLDKYMKICSIAIRIVYISFVISFLYNVIGLAFAVSGNLSPLVAAILMPVSSVTILIFTTLSAYWVRVRMKLI